MCRNRLEKMFKNKNQKSNRKPNRMGTLMCSLIVNKKSNYREYIKRIALDSSNSYKAHSIEVLKGTSSTLHHKGAIERDNSLCKIFITWLYFFRYVNKHLSPSVSVLCLVILLGYNFEKVVIK